MSNPDWQRIDEYGLRKWMFANFQGCSNHGCVVHGERPGMHTNSLCKCLSDAKPWQLVSLGHRVDSLLERIESDGLAPTKRR